MTASWAAFDSLVTPPAPGEDLPVDAHWAGFGGAHGGLLVAALARAMQEAAARPLRSVHAELLGAVSPGRLAVDASIDRSGRSVAFASARGVQDGALRLRATGVLGDGASGPLGAGLATVDALLSPPHAPPPSALSDWRVEGSPALKTVQFRPVGTNLPGAGEGLAEFVVWLAIDGDDAPLDPWRLLMLCDAPPPGLFGLVAHPFPIPTVELTAQLLPAARAAKGRWALARMRTVAAGEGWSIDDCELWDEAGAPLLVSRQTRRILG